MEEILFYEKIIIIVFSGITVFKPSINKKYRGY